MVGGDAIYTLLSFTSPCAGKRVHSQESTDVVQDVSCGGGCFLQSRGGGGIQRRGKDYLGTKGVLASKGLPIKGRGKNDRG